MKNRKKYVLSFASMGYYRLPVMQALKEELDDTICIYSGVSAVEDSIRVIQDDEFDFIAVKNIFLPGDILFQLTSYKSLITSEVTLLDLNPRFFHVWIIFFLRKVFGKKTILWGHVWSVREHGIQGFFRRILRDNADAILTYTYTQSKELNSKSPFVKTYVAPNSLYKKKQMDFSRNKIRDKLIYVGRLTKKKKPHILIEGFYNFISNYDNDVKLIFVGDGPEMNNLKRLVSDFGIEDRVIFKGHIDNYDALRELYQCSFASVSPGYVGLSITQSFAFGVPMIISKNELHSPEIEAAVEGFNSFFFETDNVFSLSDNINHAFEQVKSLEIRGPEICEHVSRNYSVESMAAGIISALKGV